MVDMRALYAIVTAFATFQVTCLVQTILHRWIGHRPLIRSIYASHTGSHHQIYRPEDFEQPAYRKDEASVSHTFVPAAVGIALIAWVVLPENMWSVATATVAATFVIHVYLHVHYHLSESNLSRFAWFRKRKELHRQHHVDPKTNFGVVEFFWDRVMGTLKAGGA
jgi:sterol desaturase/sphingolipid hydroxylase (fatty acid hydroxylase superfamily)